MTAARGFPAFPAQRRRGSRGRSWWARAWVTAMEDTSLDRDELRRARRFAGSGRVGPITVSPGRIAAVVDDPDASYEVVVRLAELSDAEWDRFSDQIAAEAGHIAALLDREMPRALARAAEAAGVALLPGIGDLEPECDCPDWGDPCRHAAALCYQAAWLLDSDPLVLLLLRGRAIDELLTDLSARRTAREGPGAGADARAAYAAPSVPLPSRPPLPPPVAADGVPRVPAAPGVAPEAVALLVADAADRARRLLAGTPSAALDGWADAVRWAATHPAVRDRIRAANPRGDVLDRAVAAWVHGGADGLTVLEQPWRPSADELARIRVAVTALPEGPGEPAAPGLQLRHGPDGRWYPFRLVDGVWWPAGRPGPDPEDVLDELVASSGAGARDDTRRVVGVPPGTGDPADGRV